MGFFHLNFCLVEDHKFYRLNFLFKIKYIYCTYTINVNDKQVQQVSELQSHYIHYRSCTHDISILKWKQKGELQNVPGLDWTKLNFAIKYQTILLYTFLQNYINIL